VEIDQDDYPSDQFPVAADGLLLPIVDDHSPLFCRNPEQFGDGTQAVYLLSTNRPTWWLASELPWMSRARLEELIQSANDKWAAVCDVKASRATSAEKANFYITVASLDGPGGVLADMELPSPGKRQQRMRIDAAESALESALELILTHELGHAYALQHFPVGPPAELMEPSLNRSLSGPQPTEAALMAKWYGQPVSSVPTPPVPSGVLVCTTRLEPMGDRINCTIDAQMGDKKAQLKGTKTW
jgi:hypothetical protein